MIAMLQKSIIFIEGGLLNMKKAARILYAIAKWWQLALVILAALYTIGGVIGAIISFVNGEVATGIALLITSVVWLAWEVAAWIVILNAIKKQKEDSKSKAPHIICIVVGVVAGNPCYVAGAILSLIMISKGQDVEQIQSISKEQVQDTVKKVKKEEKPEEAKEEKAE